MDKKDSFRNFNTALGDPLRDSNSSNLVEYPHLYSKIFLENCYTTLWPVNRACSVIPQLAWKKGGHLLLGGNDSLNSSDIIQFNEKIKSYNLNIQEYFLRAQITANIHRASGIILLINDGNIDNFEVPVDVDNIKSIEGLRLFDGWDLVPWFGGYSSGLIEPEYYWLGGTLLNEKKTGSSVKIHKSRVLPFYAQNSILSRYQGDAISNSWPSDSMIRKILDAVSQYMVAFQSVSHAIQSFEVTHLQIEEFCDRIAQNPSYADAVKQRAEVLAKGYSLYRVLVSDKDKEQITQISRSFAGIKDLLNAFSENLCASIGLPKSILFGEYGSSLGQLGQHEQAALAELVTTCQEVCFRPNMEKLTRYLVHSKELFVTPPQAWSWQWNNVRELTGEEVANQRKLEAEVMEKYLANNILSPKEVRNSLFGENGYQGLESIKLESQKIIKTIPIETSLDGFNIPASRLDSLSDIDIKNLKKMLK